MNLPKHPQGVHICLFNGKWRAILNRADAVGKVGLNLKKAMAYCARRNVTEGRE